MSVFLRVAVVAVVAALVVSLLFWVASAWLDRVAGPVGEPANTPDVPDAQPSADDEDPPPADCVCEDCEDLADEVAGQPTPRVLPALTRRQVARRFAAIAATHPDLRCVERAVADLYLIPDERPQGRLL